MEEIILYDSHPSMFRNHPFGFIFCILLIAAFGLGLLILLIWWIKILGTTLIVTNERIIFRQGIFSKYTNEIYHTDVRNVQIRQSLLQRILRVGTIGISSAGQAGIEITVRGIPHPQQIHDIIAQYH